MSDDRQMTHRERRLSRPAIAIHDYLAGIGALAPRLGHGFSDPELLVTAVTHPSWRNENAPGGEDNQRLEFLGDAVLGLTITQELVQRLPDRKEGELTVLKSQLVRESSLAVIAERLGVGLALKLGRGEDQTGGRHRPSVLADAMEALIGAVFLDAGYDAAREVVMRLFSEGIEVMIEQVEHSDALDPSSLSATTANWKTAVQELLQRAGLQPPVYSLEGEDGPVHLRKFRVAAVARVGETLLTAHGEGGSKKIAEHDAAAVLYKELHERIP
jgi:ribonuclease-3